MARASKLTFFKCVFTALLFAFVQTIAAKDAAVIRYGVGDGPHIHANAEGYHQVELVRLRRQVATPTSSPQDNETEALNGTGSMPTNNNNDTASSQNGTEVTSAPDRPTTAGPVVKPSTTATPAPTTTKPQTNRTDPPGLEVKEDNRKYYTITTTQVARIEQKYWRDLSNGAVHKTLSEGHRLAQTVGLKFSFKFYGHKITNVTIATGGFLYMSPFLHKFLTATQYIAPLMANFDTSLGNESNIRYLSTSETLIVQWENVHLKDQVEYGTFNFQVHLRKSGDIIFVYRDVPVNIAKIMEDKHPVKVGLSDAFYIDKDDKTLGMKRRTIYEYHRVSINLTQVLNNTVVIMNPNPTCNTARTCESCIEMHAKMGCRWCGVVQRCSDGIDWYRQNWLDSGCKYLSINDSSECGVIWTTTTTTAVNTSKRAPESSNDSSKCGAISTTTTTNTSATTTTNTTTPSKITLAETSTKFLSSRSSGTSKLVQTTPVATTVKTTPVATSVKKTTPVATTVKKTTPVATTVKTKAPVATMVKATTPVATTVKATTPVATTLKTTTPLVVRVETSSTDLRTTTTVPITTTPKITTTTTATMTVTTSAQTTTAAVNTSKQAPESGKANCSAIVTTPPAKRHSKKGGSGGGFPAGAVVAIIIVVALVVGIGGWFFYAYRNPTTSSGIWLMEHRPVAMKTKLAKMKFWKQSTPTGDKYAVESEA